jgi:hypothetical protein
MTAPPWNNLIQQHGGGDCPCVVNRSHNYSQKVLTQSNNWERKSSFLLSHSLWQGQAYGLFKLATGPLFAMFTACLNWQQVPYSTCLRHVQTGNRSLIRHVYRIFKLTTGPLFDMFTACSNWQQVPYSTCLSHIQTDNRSLIRHYLWHIQTGNRSLIRHVYGIFKLATGPLFAMFMACSNWQ